MDERPRRRKLKTVEVSVPAMSCRSDLRLISARIRDLGGVVAVEVDLDTRTVRVHGEVGIDEVRAVIAAAGYYVAG